MSNIDMMNRKKEPAKEPEVPAEYQAGLPLSTERAVTEADNAVGDDKGETPRNTNDLKD